MIHKENRRSFIVVTLILLSILIIPFIYAEVQVQTLGTFKQGNTINLIQSCANSTYSNLTRIIYPDSTFALEGDFAMTKAGNNYNYSVSYSNLTGQYIVYGSCDENGLNTPWVYDYYVNPLGAEVSISQSLFYIVVMALLFFGLIFFLTKTTKAENFGWSLGYGLFSYLLFLGLAFIAWKFSVNFLYDLPFIADFLYYVWLILLLLLFPMIIFAILKLLLNMAEELQRKKLKKYGYDDSEIDRHMKKRR